MGVMQMKCRTAQIAYIYYEMMKNVLLISYYFPPINVVASLRAGKMAKYLPHYGWQPWVLTVIPPPAVHQTMLVEMPEDRILRTQYLRPRIRKAPPATLSTSTEKLSGSPSKTEALYRKVEKVLQLSNSRMPDRTLGWYPYAVQAGRRLLSQVQFDAIYSVFGPPTCHLIANCLQRISGVPWIADYRDLWSFNHYQLRGPLWQWAEERFERLIVRRAAHLVTVTKPWGEKLARFTRQHVAVIPHGFDAQDFKDLPAYDPDPGEPFVLLYAGTLYPAYQDPTPLFQAVRILHQASHIHSGDFLIRFVGTDPGYPASLAKEFQISDYLAFTPVVPYATSLQMQSQASALLLFKWGDDQETGHCPAKLYEYLGAGRPILALGDKRDVVDDVLEECGAGVLVASVEEAVEVLQSWVVTFKSLGKLPWHFNRECIKRYTRSEAARALADLLNKVVGEAGTL